MWAGRCRRSRARSAVVSRMAQPPSLSRQQSSSRSGSATKREAWWSASVIGSPRHAWGPRAAPRGARPLAEVVLGGAVVEHVPRGDRAPLRHGRDPAEGPLPLVEAGDARRDLLPRPAALIGALPVRRPPAAVAGTKGEHHGGVA